MQEITFTVDPSVHRLSAVKKTGYRFGARCFVKIELLSEGAIRVGLTPKTEGTPLSALEQEFRNELLDQDLRESIAEETERVRNLLLAQAFSGLSLAGDAAESADYHDDPLGIGRSQAEKH